MNRIDNEVPDNEVLIKRETLVLPELGALYRKRKIEKKKRLEQYNSNNKLIHPWTLHQQIQPTSHTHTHTHTHTHSVRKHVHTEALKHIYTHTHTPTQT